jgi:hypothetical protein
VARRRDRIPDRKEESDWQTKDQGPTLAGRAQLLAFLAEHEAAAIEAARAHPDCPRGRYNTGSVVSTTPA